MTLAATHHSSRLAPSLLITSDANDNRAALASMTHPKEHPSFPSASQQQPTSTSTTTAADSNPDGGGGASGREVEAVALEQDARSYAYDTATHAAAAAARRDDDVSAVGAAAAAASDTNAAEDDPMFADAATLEAYANAAATKRCKEEVLEEKMQDEGYMQQLVAAAEVQVRNEGGGADVDAEVEAESSTDATQTSGEDSSGSADDDSDYGIASLTQSDGPSAAPSAATTAADDASSSPAAAPTAAVGDAEADADAADYDASTPASAPAAQPTPADTPAAVDAAPSPPPAAVVKAEWLVNISEPLQTYSDMALAPAPPLITKDAGFVDASWATDDYRTAHVSTKDPGAENSLDPIVSAPVGLYKLNSVVTHSLKAPGFNPKRLVSTLEPIK
jgi:hypothetical protein